MFSSRVYIALRQVILIAFIGKKKTKTIKNSSSKANSCTKRCNTTVRFTASVNPGNHVKIKDCWNQSTVQSLWGSGKANSRVSHLILSPYPMESFIRAAKGRYGKLGVSGVGHSLRALSDWVSSNKTKVITKANQNNGYHDH